MPGYLLLMAPKMIPFHLFEENPTNTAAGPAQEALQNVENNNADKSLAFAKKKSLSMAAPIRSSSTVVTDSTENCEELNDTESTRRPFYPQNSIARLNSIKRTGLSMNQMAEFNSMVSNEVSHEANEFQRKKSTYEYISSPALSVLDDINQRNGREMVQLRNMSRPPAYARTIKEAVNVILSNDQTNIELARPEQAKWFDTDTKVLTNFDYNSVDAAMLEKLRPFVESEHLKPEKIPKAYRALSGMAMWVHAVYSYGEANQQASTNKTIV